MTAIPRQAANKPISQVRLRLLQTSDIHANVLSFDYLADRPHPAPTGLIAAAEHVAALRSAAANCLLFDTGDMLQGTPLADYIAYERGLGARRPHPVIEAMNAMGYDAAVPGNHDFDYGLDFLRTAAAAAGFPFVCTNIADAETGETPFPRHVLLERRVVDSGGRAHPLRIGVIGFVPPQTTDWDRHVFGPRIRSRDIVGSAARAVPELRAAGADLVVALAHSGIADAPGGTRRENASLALARVPGIDAILAGHSHRVFPGPGTDTRPGVDRAAGTLHGVPAVLPGFNGSHLGVIDLCLRPVGDGWRVTAHRAEARPTRARLRGATTDPGAAARVAQAVETAHAETLASLARPIGETAVPLHTYFYSVAPSAALQLIADAQRWCLAEHLRGSALDGLPILSAATPYRAGGFAGPAAYTDIPAGRLTQRMLAQLYIYPNVLQGTVLTGAGLRAWLDRAAGAYQQVRPGSQDAPLLVPGAASYDFDVIDGVGYRVDLSRPARYAPDGRLLNPDAPSRIVDLVCNGRPVADADRFVLATNNYRMGGGGRYPGIDGAAPRIEPGLSIRDVLSRYLRAQPSVAPAPHTGWGFLPLARTSVRFHTGPGAKQVERDLPGDRLERLGMTDDGYLGYRLWL